MSPSGLKLAIGVALAVTLAVGVFSYKAGVATGRLVMYNEFYDSLCNLKTGVQIKDIRVRPYEIFKDNEIENHDCGYCHNKPSRWIKVEYE